MFCGECGEPITPSARFCSACGAESWAISASSGRTLATNAPSVSVGGPETPVVSTALGLTQKAPSRKIRWLVVLGWTVIAVFLSLPTTILFLPLFSSTSEVPFYSALDTSTFSLSYWFTYYFWGELLGVRVPFWFGFAFWGALFCVWARMGWREAISVREKVLAAVLTLAPNLTVISLAVYLTIVEVLHSPTYSR